MCLLTFFPAGVEPDIAALYIGAENNPDGHGYAIVDVKRNRIITYRGLDEDRVIQRFIKERIKYPDGPALFHSRIGTAGKMKKQNCHPFYVGDDRRTVIAHNGILPRKAQPKNGEIRSDTRLLAERWLPKGRFGHLRTKRGRRHIARWLGGGNKLVVLTVNPEYRGGNAFIMNEAQGEWHEGVWYSNDSYRFLWPRYTRPSSYSHSYVSDGKGGLVRLAKSDAWEWDDYDDGPAAIVKYEGPTGCVLGYPDQPSRESSPDDCAYCGAKHSLNAVTGICVYCTTCAGCGDVERDCLCWVPGDLRKDIREDVLNAALEDLDAGTLSAIERGDVDLRDVIDSL